MNYEWKVFDGTCFSIYEEEGWFLRVTSIQGSHVWPLPVCFWEGVTWRNIHALLYEISGNIHFSLSMDPLKHIPRSLAALFKPDTRKLILENNQEGLHGNVPFITKTRFYLCRDGCLIRESETAENTGNPMKRGTSFIHLITQFSCKIQKSLIYNV